MTLNDYQQAALRTARDADGELQPMWYLALGLTGEAGEVANLVKKFERHGKPFDADAVADELGDVLWYLAVAASAAGLTLDEVAARNVEKLRARYPDGFKPRGGGSDADKAAKVEPAVETDPRPTGEHPVEPAPVPVPMPVSAPAPSTQPDDGVRVGEWENTLLWYTEGTVDVANPLAAVAVETGYWRTFAADRKTQHADYAPTPTLKAARFAAEEWLRERHPHAFDDRKNKETGSGE